MINDNIVFIGLDTHKEFTEVAYCQDHRGDKPIHQGKIKTTKQAFEKLVRQFQSKYPKATCILSMRPVLADIGYTGCSPGWGSVAILSRLR